MDVLFVKLFVTSLYLYIFFFVLFSSQFFIDSYKVIVSYFQAKTFYPSFFTMKSVIILTVLSPIFVHRLIYYKYNMRQTYMKVIPEFENASLSAVNSKISSPTPRTSLAFWRGFIIIYYVKLMCMFIVFFVIFDDEIY